MSAAATPVNLNAIVAQSRAFLASAHNRAARNVIAKVGYDAAVVDRDAHNARNYVFSHKISQENKAANQKNSGRCWMFAAYNIMRQPMLQRLNLPDTFEISQSYLFFYDKLERANYFLEQIIDTRTLDVGDRVVQHLLTTPFNDGGQWDMLHDLILKYGLVPQSVFPETYCSSKSLRLNRIITHKAREFAVQLRDMAADGADEAALRARKEEQVADIHHVLLLFFGQPPQQFDWTYTNKKGEYVCVPNLTPESFFKEHVKFPLQNQVSIVHDPRNEYGKTLTVDRLGNVVGGQRGTITYLNLDIDELRKYAMAMINADKPVWFGCDVGKEFSRAAATMDPNQFDVESMCSAAAVPKMTKKQRLLYGDSLMTHAMVFTGYDVTAEHATAAVERRKAEAKAKAKAKKEKEAAKKAEGQDDEDDEKSEEEDKKKSVEPMLPVSALTKWRVENSWGSDSANKGYYVMSDAWFSEYMFQLNVDTDFLSDEHKAALKEAPKVLPPYDPLGALAKSIDNDECGDMVKSVFESQE